MCLSPANCSKFSLLAAPRHACRCIALDTHCFVGLGVGREGGSHKGVGVNIEPAL